MRKIPTLFQRDPDDRRHLLVAPTPGCEWVLAGEGVATRKYDGTCVRIERVEGPVPEIRGWARREVKIGKPGDGANGVLCIPEELTDDYDDNAFVDAILAAVSVAIPDDPSPPTAVTYPLTAILPAGFQPVHYDPETGKIQGWEPIHQTGWFKFFEEALSGWETDGTYELCGPKINKNPEGYPVHVLVRHDTAEVLDGMSRTYFGLKAMLSSPSFPFEGIVWHHPDGRMAKIKKRDFT